MKKDMTAIVDKAMTKLESMSDDEVLAFFNQHKDGGIFTEMLSHGLLPSFLDLNAHYLLVNDDYRQFIADIAIASSVKATQQSIENIVPANNETPFLLAA
jgi:hypothetical protein